MNDTERIFQIEILERDWMRLLVYLQNACHPQVFYVPEEDIAAAAAGKAMGSARAAVAVLADLMGRTDQGDQLRSILKNDGEWNAPQ